MNALNWFFYITAIILVILRLAGKYRLDWLYIIAIGAIPFLLETICVFIGGSIIYFMNRW